MTEHDLQSEFGSETFDDITIGRIEHMRSKSALVAINTSSDLSEEGSDYEIEESEEKSPIPADQLLISKGSGIIASEKKRTDQR